MNNKINILAALAILGVYSLACNMSTANMSSLKTGKDKEAKQETTSFEPGDTIFAVATISNSPGKVTVDFRLKADDVSGMQKGDVIKGSEVKVELPSSGTAYYSIPIPTGVTRGKYVLEADMINEAGEKKDGKSASITIDAPARST